MKKNTLILSIVVLLVSSLFLAVSFAWLSNRSGGSDITIQTGAVDTDLLLNLSLNKGIPHETVAVAGNLPPDSVVDCNYIPQLTDTASNPYFFKLTYLVSYEDGTVFSDSNPAYITNLALQNIDDLEEIPYDKTTCTLVYYGVNNDPSVDLDLGPLLASFDRLRNSKQQEPFFIKADIQACQLTEAAVEDIFGAEGVTAFNTLTGSVGP